MSEAGTKPGTSLQRFRQQGQANVARRKEINALAQSLMDNRQWGKVHGKLLSEREAYALARMCHVTKADPILDIDLLGGHPYHNAHYFQRRAQNHERYVDCEYVNILNDPAKREEYGVPEDAAGAYEVILTVYLPSAPLAAIKAGKVPFDEAMKWTTTVAAANWAGHTKIVNTRDGPQKRLDSIGATEPDKTARTRAYRRTAVATFGVEFIDEQAVEQAERVLEAEWEYVDDSQHANVQDGEMMVGAGEPAATIDADIVDVDDESEAEGDAEPEPEPEPEVDMGELRRRYFATLRAVGIDDDGRKGFQAEHGLPDSVTKFTPAHFEAAHEAIMKPLQTTVEELCRKVGTTLADVSLQELQMERPDYARDWVLLRTILKARADRASETGDQYDMIAEDNSL